MKRQQLRRNAAACLVFLALNFAGATTGNAQTWHWKYVTHTPNIPTLTADSTVAVEAGQLRMTYTIPLHQRQVVIESCHAALGDIANATTLHSQGRAFLLVALKASRPASCVSGQRPAVALPSDDERYITGVAAAINRSCCLPAAVVAKAKAAPAPTPTAIPTRAPTPTPSPTPSPSPSSKPSPATIDWVENAGSFSFVRVKNMGTEPLRVSSVDVNSCYDVALGCGRQPRTFVVGARSVTTIAVVTSADGSHAPAFEYRYIAAHASVTSSRSGSSGSAAPSPVAHMSAQEISRAEAGTVGGIRSAQPAAAADFAPARLLKRGSSRLAIGETGTALVRLVIAENGTPQEATIVSITNRRLAAAAIETAVSSTFAPATQNGSPVAAKYVATFSFDGEDPALSSIPVWKRSPAPSVSSIPPAVSASVTPSPNPSASSAADSGSSATTPEPLKPALTPQPTGSADASQPVISPVAPQPAASSAAPQPAASSAAPQPAASSATPQAAVSPLIPEPQASPLAPAPAPAPTPSGVPQPASSAPPNSQPEASRQH